MFKDPQYDFGTDQKKSDHINLRNFSLNYSYIFKDYIY